MTRRQVRGHFYVAELDRFAIGDDAIGLDRLIAESIAEGEIAFAAPGEQFAVGRTRNQARGAQLLDFGEAPGMIEWAWLLSRILTSAR